MMLTLEAPDGTSVTLVIEAKTTSTTRDLANAAQQLSRYVSSIDQGTGTSAIGLLASPYISPTARAKLRERGIGYADLTGNLWLTSARPAVFIETQGADRNPNPGNSTLKSLRGRATGAALRALVDFKAPTGLRELAERADVAPATLSRVAGLLENEELLERDRDGSIAFVDWIGTLRRWTQDYSLLGSNRAAEYIAPRGLDAVIRDLQTSSAQEYALSGTYALPQGLRVAPPRLALVYSSNLPSLAGVLDIRPADRGANVILLEPFDQVIFARTRREGGLVQVALTQLFVDLAPGRGPAEAEELLAWMTENEDAWRG
ncbi:MAG: hypothetical protein WD184_05360 [Acidimicrobiia bacterium]